MNIEKGYENNVVDFYLKHAPFNISVDVGAGGGFHTQNLSQLYLEENDLPLLEHEGEHKYLKNHHDLFCDPK